MKDKLLSRRIPTLLGIALIVLGILFTSSLTNYQTNLQSTASISNVPQNIKITNVSDNSFTITYETDSVTTGSVNYGPNNQLGNIELDDLDKNTGRLSSKNIHSITLKNLFPDTKYQLAIISGQDTFLNSEVPFEILTAPSILTTSPQGFDVKGKVVLPNGNPPSEAIIYLSTKNSQLLSTHVAKDGQFSFPIKSIRSSNLSSYINLNPNDILKLHVIGESLQSTILITLGQANSIPPITISNNYDFTNKSSSVASNSATPLGFPTITIASQSADIQILNPKKDQSLANPTLQFNGTSLPNEKVEIIIHSDEEINTQITSDNNGHWTYKPPGNLSPGLHTITIKTRDSSGILKTLAQSFVVSGEGNQAEFATESAMQTSIITPILTPTPTTALPSPTSSFDLKNSFSNIGDSSAVAPFALGAIVAIIAGIGLFLLTFAIL